MSSCSSHHRITVAALFCAAIVVAVPIASEAQTIRLGALALASDDGCYAGGCTPPPQPWPPGDPAPDTATATWVAHDASDDSPQPAPKVCIGYCPGANSGMMLPWDWSDTRQIWRGTDILEFFSDPSQGGGGGQGKNPPDSPRKPNR